MNKKEQIIEEVMQIVLSECCYSFRPVTKDELIAKHGNTIIQKTRCIFVTMLIFLNYDKNTIAAYLRRSTQAIEDILFSAHQFRISKDDAWSYRVSEAECTKRCEPFKDM